jgi:hypothetical protein
MANTFELIASSTVGSGGAASIDFTSIPSTFTDLLLKLSTRTDTSGQDYFALNISYNGSTTSFTNKSLYGVNTTTGSGGGAYRYATYSEGPLMTASTFANGEIYIPNYAGSSYKSLSADSVTETNAAAAIVAFHSTLWSNTAAINQITLTSSVGGNFVEHSSAYLYGVKNA